MKSDIFKVDDKMKVLEASMNRITSLASRVDDALSVKRREIVKLNTIKTDLDKFDMLCRFPEILAADLNAYKEMVRVGEVDYINLFSKSVETYSLCFAKLHEFKEE